MTFLDKAIIIGVACGIAFTLIAIYDTQFKEYNPEEDLFL